MKQYNGINNYDLPKTINFNLTWRCNIKCLMCNYENQHRYEQNELTASQIVKTVKEYRACFDINKVRFWGGEPFMRKDLPAIIAQVSPLVNTLVITNGMLITENNANELILGGLDTIEFSIDLPEKHHDMLRGKGTFKAARNGLRILHRKKDQLNSKTPKIVIRPLITKANYLHFNSLHRWAVENRFDFQFVFLRDWYEALMNTWFDDKQIGYYQPGLDRYHKNKKIAELALSPADCDRIWETYYILNHSTSRNRCKNRMRAFLRSMDSKLKSFIYTDCTRSRNNVLIDPYGHLYPCELLRYTYGHCLTDGSESWFSEKRRLIRKKIIDGSLPICRECNRYGHKRPLLSTFIYFSRLKDYLKGANTTLPSLKSIRMRIRKSNN